MFTTYKKIIRCNKAQAFKLTNLPHRSLQEGCVGYDFALTATKVVLDTSAVSHTKSR